MNSIKNYNQLLDKVGKTALQKDLDLSSAEDLSIGIMNLISIEEHLFFTSQKTGKEMYLGLLNEVRIMRTEMLREIITEYEGEVWCISKHLLAATMRLTEVGTKELKKGDKKKAKILFKNAYKLYSLFWGINIGVVDNVEFENTNVNLLDEKSNLKKYTSVFDKLGSMVKSAIDCCRE